MIYLKNNKNENFWPFNFEKKWAKVTEVIKKKVHKVLNVKCFNNLVMQTCMIVFFF